jgi:hypothetical protein
MLTDLEGKREALTEQLRKVESLIVSVREVLCLGPEAPPRTVTIARKVPKPRRVSMLSTSTAVSPREAAILTRIAGGTRQLDALRRAVPVARGASAAQHDAATRNTLSRLRIKGCVVPSEHGWTLTDKGRSAVGTPTKEAP